MKTKKEKTIFHVDEELTNEKLSMITGGTAGLKFSATVSLAPATLAAESQKKKDSDSDADAAKALPGLN